VVGEDGQPVSGADATFVFNEGPVGFGTVKEVPVVTDEKGNFTAEGYSETGTVGFVRRSIHKDGYYESGVNAGPFYEIKDGRWQPWDQAYTTVLRKIGKPVPMYVRHASITVPGGINEPRGYDLLDADWVPPYGKGHSPDFIVTMTDMQYRSWNDHEASATITFSNEGDGIQEVKLPKEWANSQFNWPREAPESGYGPKHEAHRKWLNVDNRQGTTSLDTSNENQAHFFRVRTVQKDGKVIGALYGKIRGGISVGSDGKTGVLSFFYYLNPTSLDRNMEFTGNNLFRGLKLREDSHIP